MKQAEGTRAARRPSVSPNAVCAYFPCWLSQSVTFFSMRAAMSPSVSAGWNFLPTMCS